MKSKKSKKKPKYILSAKDKIIQKILGLNTGDYNVYLAVKKTFYN